MKVKELIEKLQKVDPEIEVIMQKDAEGNGYSPLADIYDDAIYIADSTWSGEVKDARWSADDACMEEDEWQKFLNENPRALILEPVN